MPAFDQIILSHVTLLVPADIIAAIAIIEAAVAAITGVVVAVIVVHTSWRSHSHDRCCRSCSRRSRYVTHHNHGHLKDTTAGHNLTKDADLTHTAGAGLDLHEEGTAVIPIQSLQITNAPSVIQDLPGRSYTELIKAVECSH